MRARVARTVPRAYLVVIVTVQGVLSVCTVMLGTIVTLPRNYRVLKVITHMVTVACVMNVNLEHSLLI